MLDQLMTWAMLAHAGATWFMVGLIWFVQLVHYPLMGKVSPDDFSAYAGEHQRRTTWIVAPVMLVEACTAGWLVWLGGSGSVEVYWAWVGVAMLGVVWISTFAVQVPLHAKLARGFDRSAWRRLVMSNWIRTVGWSVRGVVALMLLR